MCVGRPRSCARRKCWGRGLQRLQVTSFLRFFDQRGAQWWTEVGWIKLSSVAVCSKRCLQMRSLNAGAKKKQMREMIVRGFKDDIRKDCVACAFSFIPHPHKEQTTKQQKRCSHNTIPCTATNVCLCKDVCRGSSVCGMWGRLQCCCMIVTVWWFHSTERSSTQSTGCVQRVRVYSFTHERCYSE